MRTDVPPATVAQPATILAALELSQKSWIITVQPPDVAKMSRHTVEARECSKLFAVLDIHRAKTAARTGGEVTIVTIHEAGLDGFWLHRRLEAYGIESHVVDAASIAAPRRQRRPKTDKIDGETLVSTLAAWRRGEPRVCSMVAPPAPEQEDRRRLSRERERLLSERIGLTNRIGGLFASQGIRGYQPLKQNRWQALAAVRTGDGCPLPAHLMAELRRMMVRLELTVQQIAAVDEELDELLDAAEEASIAALLRRLRGIGPHFASVLVLECLYRTFGNRRQLAAFAGLAPTPWRSGSINCEQGISGGGNPRLRKAMIELAWMWARWQPGSALSRWFQQKIAGANGRTKRIMAVALARKLLIALWRYGQDGVVPEGAVLKAA
jgi:transposase